MFSPTPNILSFTFKMFPFVTTTSSLRMSSATLRTPITSLWIAFIAANILVCVARLVNVPVDWVVVAAGTDDVG